MDFIIGGGFALDGIDAGIERHRTSSLSLRGGIAILHNGADTPTIEIFDGYLFGSQGFRHGLIGGSGLEGEGVFVAGSISPSGTGT